MWHGPLVFRVVDHPADTPTMTTTPTPCPCASFDLLTVRQTAALPVMANVSAPTLYRLIEAGKFKARPVSERKTLVLVTEWCPVHERKQPDDIDGWLASMVA